MAAQLQYTLANIPNFKQGKVLTLSGDIDESNQDVLINIMEQILGIPQTSEKFPSLLKSDEQVKYLVINIKNLAFINSGVIGLFATFHAKFSDVGKEFVFAEANDHIFDIIDLVGLTEIITVFATNEEAALSFED